MASADPHGDPPVPYCPNCGRRLEVLPSGLQLCVRCGVIGDPEHTPISSKPPHPPELTYFERLKLLQVVTPDPPADASRLRERPRRPRTRRARKYGCRDCPPDCDFLPRFRDALREWHGDHPGQRSTAKAIAGKLNYSDRHLRRLRRQHGFADHWPPPKKLWSKA